MTTRYKDRRRKDYVVVERNGQLVPVKRRTYYQPKPQQAVIVFNPHVPVLPPPRPSLEIMVVTKRRRNFWGEEETAFEVSSNRSVSPVGLNFLASLFNLVAVIKSRD